MTATDRAMCTEAEDRIRELEDRVTIDDALIGDLRGRIRKLEAENDRLRVILDGCDDAAERVALVLFARSFIPMRTVDQVPYRWSNQQGEDEWHLEIEHDINFPPGQDSAPASRDSQQTETES